MKLSLFFVAILGVATVSAVPAGKALNRSTRDLSDDWADFRALIDTDAIRELVVQYLAEDEEFQTVVAYLKSDDFVALIVALEAIDDYIAFLDYLEAAGLNVYYYINVIHGFLGLDDLKTTSSLSASRLITSRITGGIAGFWADLKAILPLTELRALYDEKLEASEDFAAMIALLTSDKAQVIYDAVKANEEYQLIRAALVGYGLDIDYFFDWLRALIGWA